MSDGPVHISDVMARAFSEVAGGRGRFRGLRLNEFTYPDFHAPEATLFDYRLPFEDCGKFALGDAVQPRRFVVPDVFMSDKVGTQTRGRLIKAIAWLYCAAWLDCAYASIRMLAKDQDNQTRAKYWQHIDHFRQLLARFEHALNLLTDSPMASASVLAPWHEPNHLAKVFAQAMQDGFDVLIRPTLWYENDIRPTFRYEKDGLRAVNIRTEFTPEQWISHLHLACRAAHGQAPAFPPLPRLEGNKNSGYILRLYDIDSAQLHVSSAPQDQPGALRRAC